MLLNLPVLFFFTLLIGSPVPGFITFMLIGLWAAWQSLRRPQFQGHWIWSNQDVLLSLSFMSIFFFKLLSLTWSDQPALALANAGWHLYFLFWPLVLLGIDRCKSNQSQVDKAIAIGLIFVACWRGAHMVTDWSSIHPGDAGVGLLAQLAMIMGSWNLLALTRSDESQPRWRFIRIIAFFGTLIILIASTRRQELLGFILLTAVILAFRFQNFYTPWRAFLGVLMMCTLSAGLIYIRWEKFSIGFQEIQYYFAYGTTNIEHSSWGARLEMWRVGILAFFDHPWLGLSASVRPMNLQIYGAPSLEIFSHRHFHQQFLQTLVEGGLLGLFVFSMSLGYSTYMLIIKPFKSQPEVSLLAAALLGSYFMEGLVSAALVYDKPNAVLVVTSAWLWMQIRRNKE